jgi:hypothetical protein
MSEPRPVDVDMRRHHLVAALLVVPAILGALCVVTVEAWRQYRPSSAFFNPAYVNSLADAIEADDPKAAYEFIRAGADPNGPIEVQDPILTGDRTLVVSPILWAVATESVSNVQMLLGFGGKAYAHNGRSLACLAEAMGNDRIADVVRTYGHVPAAPCPENQRIEGPPLLWFTGGD